MHGKVPETGIVLRPAHGLHPADLRLDGLGWFPTLCTCVIRCSACWLCKTVHDPCVPHHGKNSKTTGQGKQAKVIQTTGTMVLEREIMPSELEFSYRTIRRVRGGSNGRVGMPGQVRGGGYSGAGTQGLIRRGTYAGYTGAGP